MTCGYYPTVIDKRPYILVDTPGFNTTEPDLDVFRNMMTGLEMLQPFVNYVGVLYVTDLATARLPPSQIKTHKWLESFCGQAFFRNITIVTTKWDNLTEDAIMERAADILPDWRKRWEGLLDPGENLPGAEIYHHGIKGGGTGDASTWDTPLHVKRQEGDRRREAMAMIDRRYSDARPIEMQVMTEMHARGDYLRTTAAKILLGTYPISG